VVIIERPRGWAALGLRGLWSRRDLLRFLAWRDIKVRFAQATLGVAWAVLQPLLMMIVFALFLGRLAGIRDVGIPYPVFALSGLVPWTYFANAVNAAGNSLVVDANLVSKVYFPRLISPLAALISWLPDLVISSGVLLAVMLALGVTPRWSLVAVPVVALFAVVAAGGVGVWFAALNVAYRDVRHAVPFLLQLWLFATPVLYPDRLVPTRWRFVLGLNPMAGVVACFRWVLLGGRRPSGGLVALSAAVSGALLVSGMYYFRRVEHGFADVI
jgi:lipopolysaccharide transport system permease protein